MSTRCHIRVKDREGKLYPCMIYKHCDGYPEGVEPWLSPFAQGFVKARGDDCEYFIAQVLRQWAIDEYLENKERDLYKANPEYLRDLLGWGVCPTNRPHGDIEYLYTVDLRDGEVTYKHV